MWNERPWNKQKSFYYWKILLIHNIVEDIKNRIKNTDKANLVIHKNSVYIKHLTNNQINQTKKSINLMALPCNSDQKNKITKNVA